VFIHSWIERIRQSLRNNSRKHAGRRERVGRTSERLEQRSLLSAQAFFLNGGIDITLGSTDSVAVRENPNSAGTVLIVFNGLPVTNFPTVSASSVTRVTITGGDDENVIDLTGMSSTVFNNPALTIAAFGGNGADTLLGSDSLNESLDGGHGADLIVGNGGNDTLLGDDGSDSIDGGTGDDSIDAGDGQDTVDGNAGNDTILAGNGDDVIDGSAGNDSIAGGDGADTLRGGDDLDTMNGEAGNDSLDGQAGDDSLFGGAGNDTLSGNIGNDHAEGQGGSDSLLGDAGDDTLLGGDHADQLFGNDGNDVLNGQAGDDSVVGNDGNDTLSGGSGHDAVFGDSDLENNLGIGADLLFGQGGNDTLRGGGGADIMLGGDGNDVIRSGDFDSVNGVLLNVRDSISLVEGTSGVTGTAVFLVTLSQPSSGTVTVTYTTTDGSATAGSDYTAVSGTLQFAPGVTSMSVAVPVLGDTLDESNENFFLQILTSNGAFVVDGQGQAIITDDDGWVSMGPAPATGGQVENISPNNEVTGAVHVVAPHPTNPNIGFVAGVNGGIWRTTNLQASSPTWTPVSDQASSLSIGAIGFDPANANSMVAGIGRHSSLGSDGGNLTGVLRSTDGGLTWTEPGSFGLSGENLSGVAIRGNVIVVSSDTGVGFNSGGVFRSIDGGVSFTRISGTNGLAQGRVFDLVGDPTNPNRLYASVAGQGIFRSNDQGATWTNVSNGDPTLNSQMRSFGLDNAEMAVGANGRIYVITVQFGQASYIGFSDNQGGSWTQMDLPQTLLANGQVVGLNPVNPRPQNNVPGVDNRVNTLPGGQGAIHLSIVVDPTDPNIVYVGGDRQDIAFSFPNELGANDFSGRLFRGDTRQPRTNAANSPQWAHLTHSNAIAAIPTGGTASSSAPHADSRDMAFDAAGNLIEGDDGGVYRRTNPRDNTGDWFSIIGNLAVTEQHSVAYDTNSNIAISGNQDTGTTQQSASNSMVWTSVSTADGGDVAVDSLIGNNQSVRYSSTQFLGAFTRRTYDANNQLLNATLLPLTVTGGGAILPQFYTPIATNDVVGGRLIVGAGNGVFESTNQGATFTLVDANVVANLNAIAYGGTRNAVVNPDVLYVGSGNNVFLRQAAGGPLVPTAFPGGNVTGIALNPTDFFDVYVTDQSNVWHSTDAGATWVRVTGTLNDRLRNIEYVPGRAGSPDVILVGANLGVYRMDVNAPNAWREFGSDLPNVPVTEVVYDPFDDVVVVGTLGRGAWSFVNASQGDAPSTLAPESSITLPGAAGDTIFAGSGSDLIVGADGDDVINAEGDDDTVLGGLGNDSILGGAGADVLDGQAGNDTLAGQGGKDVLIGGEGDDTFQWSTAGDGDDVVSSVDGFDQMQVLGTGGADTVAVGKSGPRIQVTSGTNVLTVNNEIRVISILLGGGDDTATVGDLLGVPQTVLTINGGEGNDLLDASASIVSNLRLRLIGDAGNDVLKGSFNDDTLEGNAGADTLLGGAGNDVISGGTENDAVNGQAGNDTVTGGDGNDTLAGGDGNDLLQGNLGQDSLNGQTGNDTLEGAEGRDTLLGADGNDSLDAGGGKDYLNGGTGNDFLDGGRNDDTIEGGDGDDSIRGNHGNDSIEGGIGADTINGGDGNDTINGGDGNDLATGGDGDDALNGQAGNDTLLGGDGSDVIAGGAGGDVILGEDGQDTINGQGGSDTVSGGQGTDVIADPVSEIDENFVLSKSLLALL
jgi:Ca2+-binding RTX toxin-like protein